MRTRLCLAIALLVASMASQAALRLGVHSDEPAPTIAELLAARLPAELQPQLVAYDDVSELRRALAEGELELAFLEEPGAAIPGVAAVGELYPAVLHILVHKDSKAETLGEVLASPAIWAGVADGIGHSLAERLAQDYGVGPPDLLADPWSKEPQVYFIFGGLLASDATTRLKDYRLFSVGQPDNQQGSIADGLVLRYPNLRGFVLPAQLYPTLGHGPSLTVAVKTLLVAREDLDQNLVYQLAMATDRMKPEIASAYPLAGVETLGKSRSAARALPWHPGARRYIDRELPSLIEQYAEFVGATATMTIAVVSLLVAIYRRRRQARKDRLDTYYQQLLTCRTALRDSGANTAAIETTLYELQEEVFQLLIAERIDADSALLAFLSLSNQLLIEAKSAAPVAHDSASEQN